MSFLSSPKALYFTRLPQFGFALGFLILLSYSGAHRGWWDNINGPLACGIIASLLTFALTLHTLITHHVRGTNPFSGSTGRTVIRVAAEIILFLLWIATVVLMLRGKGGCEIQDKDKNSGITFCFLDNGNDNQIGKAIGDQPRTQWDIGIAFVVLEIVLFIVSIVMVFKEDRANKVTDTSYA